MSAITQLGPVESASPAKAWLRALELTAPITRNPDRTLPVVVEDLAKRLGTAPALLSDREQLTYRALSERANQYARWSLALGLRKGDVVCLLMANRPEYMAIWLGITSVGVVVSLLNTNLSGSSLAHCIDVVTPKHIIVSEELANTVEAVLPQLKARAILWVHSGEGSDSAGRDLEIVQFRGEPLTKNERREITIEDRALYIYTSGTTGLPKAANVSHARVMQWSHWFAGMMDVKQTDRMYNCLPMYHSVGGVQATGAMLVGGGSVAIREKFSASQFWTDIVRWDCTLFQYIGELCRYLLNTPACLAENEHRIRLACGNGLSAEVWDAFRDRFRIPHILEFYAATEGNVSLFNLQGKRGAIGHVPPYLVHRFSPALVVFDVEQGLPARDDRGRCARCAPNQPGEALSKLSADPANAGSRFEGYTSAGASESKILRDVFEPGDAWVRTGDLMRRDEKGFFYFVDRVGDTFRRKGENVAASEVAGVINAFPGIDHANVYGVIVPGTEGRVGMAAIVATEKLDLAELHAHVVSFLPPYAQPVFLRMSKQTELTGTFKYSKTELLREGYDPEACGDALYFDDPSAGEFVPLNAELYRRILCGEIKL
jgi:fatty-acyl-CoA synthase